MRIAQSSMQLSSLHYAESRHEISERLSMWTGRRPQPRPQSNDAGVHDQVALSDAGKAQAGKVHDTKSADDQFSGDLYVSLIKQLVEALTGRRIHVFDPSSLQQDDSPPAQEAPPQGADQAEQPQAGFGLEYDYHEVKEEKELTQFSAQGEIHTADGQVLNFDLSLTMARAYREETSVSLRAGDAVRSKDPLVVNFGGTAAQLTDSKFSFDLNADGTKDQVSMATGGSGFLALDRNGNGKVDDGSELFGPSTGNGFSELATLDSDHNGWIDEGDPVFASLKLWRVDASGASQLMGLKDVNVGAINLAAIGTPFSIKDARNRLQGDVRATSVYAGENGQVGTVQQVDLSV